MSTWTKLRSASVLIALSLPILMVGCGDKNEKKDNIAGNEDLPEGSVFSKTKAYVVKVETSAALVPEAFQTIQLHFTDANGVAAESVSDVTLKPWMTIHNHGTATKKLKLTPVEGKPDVIEVTNLWFTMGGPWDLLITATVNGTADDAILPVEVAR